MNINDAIDNETKCLMYALNLTDSHHESQIQHILNQLNQFKIDHSIDSNSNANANASLTTNANAQSSANANANASQKINNEIEMKNTQIEQNDSNKTQTIMKSRIKKSIDVKMEKIQLHLDSK